MQQILIPIGIMVGLSILSWLVQQMKAAADKKQMQRDRERQRTEAAARVERAAERREVERPLPPPPPPAMRAATSEVDRFMQEINKLRERAGAPPAAKPAGAGSATKVIPTVSPVRKKKRVSEESPSTFPVTSGQVATGQSLLPPPVSAPPRDELPLATVVGTPRIVSVPAALPTSPPVVTKAVKAKSAMVDRGSAPASAVGVQLMALLKDKKTMAAAMILQEVLGPPKSKRSIG